MDSTSIWVPHKWNKCGDGPGTEPEPHDVKPWYIGDAHGEAAALREALEAFRWRSDQAGPPLRVSPHAHGTPSTGAP